MNTLQLKLITKIGDLKRRQKSWQELHCSMPKASMCLSWQWVFTWCDFYLNQSDTLYVSLVYDQKKLVAIFPFYLKKIGFLKELRFIGTGEDEASEVCSEFQDILISHDYREDVKALFYQNTILSNAFHKAAFEHLLSTSYVAEFLSLVAHGDWSSNQQMTGVRFLINVEESTELQVKKIRSKTTQRQAKKVVNHSGLRCELVTNEQAFDVNFERLIQLHNNAWRKKEKSGVFEQEIFTNFHRNYARLMLKEGKLVLFSLMENDNVIGAFYGVIDGNTLFYYQSGVGECDNLPAIGVALHIHALTIARNKGIAYYDLMKGSPSSYKNKYQRSDTEVKTLELNRFPYRYLSRFVNIANKLKDKFYSN